MAKQKKKCLICGNNYKGKTCHSPQCARFKTLPPGQLRDCKIWSGVALLSGLVGTALQDQAIAEKDPIAKKIGDRVYKWSVEALYIARHFGVPMEYLEKQDRVFNDSINDIWPLNGKLHVIHAADTVQSLISDVLEHFSQKFNQKKLACWNWQECAYTKLLNTTESDILEYADQIHTDYLAFRRLFWGEKQPRERRLKMYDVGSRFTVAAYSKGEARELVRLNSGLFKLPVKGLVDTAKVEFNGETTT